METPYEELKEAIVNALNIGDSYDQRAMDARQLAMAIERMIDEKIADAFSKMRGRYE